MPPHILLPNDGQVSGPQGVYPLTGPLDTGAAGGPAGAAGTGSSASNGGPLNGARKSMNPRQTAAADTAVVYPDYSIWKHTPADDARMRNYLQKGYFEPPVVANECHSGRQTMTQLLQKPAAAAAAAAAQTSSAPPAQPDSLLHLKMQMLGDVMVKAKAERLNNNKIRGRSTYKPPPRVTLTEHKRNLWLKSLAEAAVPLRKLSKAIPHGLRNKGLLEQCLSHAVPVDRAIWLIKCVSSNEQRQLKRKAAGNAGAALVLRNRWLAEWTDQVCGFVLHIYDSSFQPRYKDSWRMRFDYTVRLVTNLYLQNLLGHESFLAWIAHYVGQFHTKSCSAPESFRPLSLHVLLLRLFWFRLIAVDYLAKELAENLLLAVARLRELPHPENPRPNAAVQKLDASLQKLVKYLFYYNSDNFIMPASWFHLKPYLKKTLDLNVAAVAEQFKLITYRNESLMLDDSETHAGQDSAVVSCYCYNKESQILYRLDNYGHEHPLSAEVSALRSLTKFVFTDASSGSGWRQALRVALHWAVTTDREAASSFQRICLVCSILQTQLSEVSQAKPKKFKQAKQDLEVEITEFVYEMSGTLSYDTPQVAPYSLTNTLILINRLYHMDLFVMSSYIRRLIASGIIYLSEPDHSCYIHLLILHSLPELSDSNAANIMRKLSETTGIKVPLELEAQSMAKTKSRLLAYKDALFAGTCQPDDFYSLLEPETDPMYVGRQLELGSWFLDRLQEEFGSSERCMQLDSGNVVLLYKLLNAQFLRYPRFVQLIFEQMDKGRVSVAGVDTLELLLKMTVYNQKQLDSYLVEADTTIWRVVNSKVDSWKQTDRFGVAAVLESAGFVSPPLVVGKDTAASGAFHCSLSQRELSLLGISSVERLSNAAEYPHHFNQAMTQYFNVVKGFNLELRQPVVVLLRDLQKWKPAEFQGLVSAYLRKFTGPSLPLDYDANLKLILGLVVHDLAGFSQVFDVFSPFSNGSKIDDFASNSYRMLHRDLLLSQDLDADEQRFFLVCFERRKFRETHPKEYCNVLLSFCTRGIESRPSAQGQEDVNMVGVDDVVSVDVMNSLHELGSVPAPMVPIDPPMSALPAMPAMPAMPPMESPRRGTVSAAKESAHAKVSPLVVDSLWEIVATHLDVFLDLFYKNGSDSVDKAELRHFFTQEMLRLSGSGGDENGNATELLAKLNYFNLVICQWLFANQVEQELSGGSSAASKMMLAVLNSVAATVPAPSVYLVGELFEFVPDQTKLAVLSACESLFLGSENFPRLNCSRKNVTDYVTAIVSSCSRFRENGASGTTGTTGQIPLSDALVFSLNLALEKLIYFCHKLERKKNVEPEETAALESAIRLISKIVLIHKGFLVELILRRSVNLQRDVLLTNLTKLFNTRLMDKNLRLKNLLYDILTSIRVSISESLALRNQKRQQQQQPQLSQPRSSKLSGPSPLTRPTPSTFRSPTSDSPPPTVGATPQSQGLLLQSSPGTKARQTWRTAMAIDPPSVNNRLKFLLPKFNMKDVLPVDTSKYYLVDAESGQMVKYIFRPFDMIEDASPREEMNNSSLSLQLFDCSVERHNP